MKVVTVQFEISETAIERERGCISGGLEYNADDIARRIVHSGLTCADDGHDLGAASQTWKVLDTEPEREAIKALVHELAIMAENELPVGCEAAMGVEWTARWRGRAQAALRLGRDVLDD